MRNLLSHPKTKDAFTAYLSEKNLLYVSKLGKHLVASWRTEAKSSEGKDISELKRHEEADTKIILHSLYAASQGAQTIHIMSQDTDVLVLSVWWSRHLPANTKFVTRVGANKRMIDTHTIRTSLGSLRVEALLGFHAISGCDITGAFSRKSKKIFWK